jgi:DNA-binding response OmpR family regulator
LIIDVLIVEDEPGILASLDFILKRAGLSVKAATDGETALKMVQSLKPSVMVLDVMLPKKNGFDILRILRAEKETKDLPILVLTAKGQKQDRQLAKELGATAFITKPYANTDVVKTVRLLLDQAQLVRNNK